MVKAIIIMRNVWLRDESKFDVSVAPDWYPIRNLQAPADECEYTYEQLIKVLNGEADPEDYNDPNSSYKLLYDDVSMVKDVVTGYTPGEELSIEDFNTENFGDFQRMYSLLVGDRPYATEDPDKKVFSKTYAMTPTMEKKWSNLQKLEDEVMLKIITGKTDVSAFDEFVEDWFAQGGQEILQEVQELE